MPRWKLTIAILASVLAAACARQEEQARDETADPQVAESEPAGPVSDPLAAADDLPPPLLDITELRAGSGPAIEPGKTAVVHYTGWLYSENAPDKKGTKFDSSVDRGEPFRFKLGAGSVIPGWEEGVAGMKVGGQRRLTIPPHLAYGDRGAGSVIPPGSTLVFDIELLGIE